MWMGLLACCSPLLGVDRWNSREHHDKGGNTGATPAVSPWPSWPSSTEKSTPKRHSVWPVEDFRFAPSAVPAIVSQSAAPVADNSIWICFYLCCHRFPAPQGVNPAARVLSDNFLSLVLQKKYSMQRQKSKNLVLIGATSTHTLIFIEEEYGVRLCAVQAIYKLDWIMMETSPRWGVTGSCDELAAWAQ